MKKNPIELLIIFTFQNIHVHSTKFLKISFKRKYFLTYLLCQGKEKGKKNEKCSISNEIKSYLPRTKPHFSKPSHNKTIFFS